MGLEKLIDEIRKEHLERLDRCEETPMRRTGRRRRPRPRTAIISEAAKEADEEEP